MVRSSTTEDSVLVLPVKDADAGLQKRNAALKLKKVRKAKKVKAKTKAIPRPIKEPAPSPSPQTLRITKGELVRSVKREPLGHLLVEHLLRDAGFRGIVSTNKGLLDAYATDESIFYIRPQIVLQPKNQKDVEIAVKVLGKETKRFPSLSLTPRAAGTGLSGGSLTDSIVVDVCKFMDFIDEPHEVGGTTAITCGPGAMWRDVEAKLKTLGTYLPPFPASKDICSIGGSVANNCAGPDSLRFGHVANAVESLDVTFYDGNTYTINALSYKEFRSLIKQKHTHAKIAKEVFDLIEKNEALIKRSRPKTKKNTAGYALWDVIDTSVAEFKKGKGLFDLKRLIAGSQGTIGIITKITLKAEKIDSGTSLIVIPMFDLSAAGKTIIKALEFEPTNVELFDSLTFSLALKNPNFFRTRLGGMDYYRVLLSMYTLYHVRYKGKVPEFTVLITLRSGYQKSELYNIVRELRALGSKQARLVTSTTEKEMLWQIRRASYLLSKLEDAGKRPAAFLEDMTVPPENMPKFFMEIKRLLKKYNVGAAVHGHGGNGHLHFYPLLDFTRSTTPALIMKMAEEFYNLAIKHKGNICGEHNDGIIRTPHLSKVFKKQTLDLFRAVEHIFDPDDIFNPGKKVNPRFDIKESIRHTN